MRLCYPVVLFDNVSLQILLITSNNITCVSLYFSFPSKKEASKGSEERAKLFADPKSGEREKKRFFCRAIPTLLRLTKISGPRSFLYETRGDLLNGGHATHRHSRTGIRKWRMCPLKNRPRTVALALGSAVISLTNVLHWPRKWSSEEHRESSYVHHATVCCIFQRLLRIATPLLHSATNYAVSFSWMTRLYRKLKLRTSMSKTDQVWVKFEYNRRVCVKLTKF